MAKGISSAFTDSETENIDVLYENKIENKALLCSFNLLFSLA